MLDAENMSCLQNPIYEAEYTLERENPLKFFDPFVPHLEEHRRIKNMTLIQELKYMQNKRRIQEGLEGTKIEMLQSENKILKQKLYQQLKKAEVVKWYIDVME